METLQAAPRADLIEWAGFYDEGSMYASFTCGDFFIQGYWPAITFAWELTRAGKSANAKVDFFLPMFGGQFNLHGMSKMTREGDVITAPYQAVGKTTNVHFAGWNLGLTTFSTSGTITLDIPTETMEMSIDLWFKEGPRRLVDGVEVEFKGCTMFINVAASPVGIMQ